jgi:hypothetical protein
MKIAIDKLVVHVDFSDGESAVDIGDSRDVCRDIAEYLRSVGMLCPVDFQCKLLINGQTRIHTISHDSKALCH